MKNKIIFCVVILVISLAGIKLWAYQDQEKLSYTIPQHDDVYKMKLDKLEWEKRYELTYRFDLCEGRIFINDMAGLDGLHDKLSGATHSYGHVFNEVIFKPELQKIRLEVFPLNNGKEFDPESRFKMKVKEIDKRFNGYSVIKDSVIGFSFNYSKELSTKSKMVYEGEFLADVGYKNTLFDGAADLSALEPKRLDELVKSASTKLLKNIEGKYYQNIEDVFYFRRMRINLASYLPVDNKVNGFKSLNDLLKSGLKLKKVSVDDVKYSILKDSRFVYVNKKDGQALLNFENEEMEMSTEIIFFMPKGSDELFVF